MNESIVDRVIKQAGGPTKLAHHLKVTSQAISQWHTIPHKRVIAIEGLTGISRSELRPDLYPETTAA